MIPYIFQGYRDLVLNFWQTDDERDIDSWIHIPVDWLQGKVVFINADECTDEFKDALSECFTDNEQVATLKFAGHEMQILILAGDGGFNACLMKPEDWDKIRQAGIILPYISNE
jgi:hypothetical protein